MDAGVVWLVGLVGVFVGVAVVRSVGQWWSDRRQPELSIAARLEALEVRRDQGSGWEPAERRVAVFVDDAGVRREFDVSECDAARWLPGMSGSLRCRGRLLRGFIPDA